MRLKAAERSQPRFPVRCADQGGDDGVGSFTPALPGIEMPNKYLSFPYEPTRISSYLPGAAMDRYSAFWISETAHGAEAATTGEGGSKPDLSPTLTITRSLAIKSLGSFRTHMRSNWTSPAVSAGGFSTPCSDRLSTRRTRYWWRHHRVEATLQRLDSTRRSTLTQNGAGLNGLDAIITAAAAMRSSTSSFASPDLSDHVAEHGGRDFAGKGQPG